MRYTQGLAVAWLAAVSLAIVPSHAATHLVQPDGSGDFPTIQEAISSSSSGDSVALADGVFSGPGNRDIDYQGKPITVYSLSGNADACIIDCEGGPGAPHRGFIFNELESPTSILDGVTIINGYREYVDPPIPDAYGGGILIMNASSPTLRNVVVRDCSAPTAGAVCILEGSPSFIGCAFEDNVATFGGPAGVFGHDGYFLFEDCRFEANLGYQIGGALACNGPCELALLHCFFRANDLQSPGYASAVSAGWACLSAEISHCTFVDNTFGAVGIECPASIEHCTFYGNESPFAACLVVYYEQVEVANSIFSHSTAGKAIGCADGGEVALSCCDVFGNPDGDYVDCIADFAGVNGNISLDPGICSPVAGDFHLTAESPCAPFSEPNPDCDLIGAYSVGCAPAGIEGEREWSDAPLALDQLQCRPTITTGPATIRLQLDAPVRAPAHCAVFDATGRRVAAVKLIHAGNALTGHWPGVDTAGEPVPSGVYFLRVSQGGHAVTRSVTLVR